MTPWEWKRGLWVNLCLGKFDVWGALRADDWVSVCFLFWNKDHGERERETLVWCGGMGGAIRSNMAVNSVIRGI